MKSGRLIAEEEVINYAEMNDKESNGYGTNVDFTGSVPCPVATSIALVVLSVWILLPES